MGCLVWIFIWPFQLIGILFRSVYLIFKLIWEIAEFFSRLSQHKKHRRTPVRKKSPRSASHKSTRNSKVKDVTPETKDQDVIHSIVTSVSRGRNKHLQLEKRLTEYRAAFRFMDLARYLLPSSQFIWLDDLESTALAEYRKLMEDNSHTEGMITVAPALNLLTSSDARREGIQAAQWSASPEACPLCKFLDGMVISVDDADFNRFLKPPHPACKCFWIFIGVNQTQVEFTWVTPSPSLLEQYAPSLL